MFLYSSFYIVVAQYFSSHNVEQANKINLNKHNNGTCMAVFPAAFEWLNIQCNFPNIWALYLIFNTKSRMGKLLMISSGFQATVQTLILIHLSQDVKCQCWSSAWLYIFMTSPLINSHGASSSRKQNWLCNHDANPRLKERKLGEGSRALQHSPHGKVTLERVQEGSLYTNLTPTDANLFQGSNDLSVNESVSQKIHQPTKWQNNNPVPRMCHR